MMQKILLIAAVIMCVVLFFVFDLQHQLTLENIKLNQVKLDAFYQDKPLWVMSVFFAVYVLVAALSLPGAAVMTLAIGAVFGFALGLVLVSFASSIGAVLAFLLSRYLFRDWVENKFGVHLNAINQGLKKEGAFYLFTLRLIPLFPFFAVNLLMGLTHLKTRTFYWVSQLGMLAGTAVYVNAGTQLAQVQSTADIFTLPLIFSFILLGLFPLLAKKMISWLKHKHIIKQ